MLCLCLSFDLRIAVASFCSLLRLLWILMGLLWNSMRLLWICGFLCRSGREGYGLIWAWWLVGSS